MTCSQQEEEKKIQDSELRHRISQQKDKVRTKENAINKLQWKLEESLKKEAASKQKLEESVVLVKKLVGERDKAADAVVPDPEKLEQELVQSKSELLVQNEALASLNERLPVLEQQLQDRITQMQIRKDISQRFAELKSRENQIRYNVERFRCFFFVKALNDIPRYYLL